MHQVLDVYRMRELQGNPLRNGLAGYKCWITTITVTVFMVYRSDRFYYKLVTLKLMEVMEGALYNKTGTHFS